MNDVIEGRKKVTQKIGLNYTNSIMSGGNHISQLYSQPRYSSNAVPSEVKQSLPIALPLLHKSIDPLRRLNGFHSVLLSLLIQLIDSREIGLGRWLEKVSCDHEPAWKRQDVRMKTYIWGDSCTHL
jgi:hypothetical protein